jgi:hypothetical protein
VKVASAVVALALLTGCAAFQKDLSESPACVGLDVGGVISEDVVLFTQLATEIPALQLSAVISSFTAAHGQQQAECVYDLVEAQLGHPVAQPDAGPAPSPSALTLAMGAPRPGGLEALANFRAARAAAKH